MNNTKAFSEQFEGASDHYPVNKGFEANRSGKFIRMFGNIFVAQFLCGTFAVPKFCFRKAMESLGGSQRGQAPEFSAT